MAVKTPTSNGSYSGEGQIRAKGLCKKGRVSWDADIFTGDMSRGPESHISLWLWDLLDLYFLRPQRWSVSTQKKPGEAHPYTLYLL